MSMLKIHETFGAGGALRTTQLRVDDDGTIWLVSLDDAMPLPDRALDAVMDRFGAPIEPGERLADVDALDLGGGRVLRHVRHLARFDVVAKDWLVLERPGREPVCALATTVAGALDHLARAAKKA